MDANFISELEATLKMVTLPDSATVKAATKKLKKEFHPNPMAFPALVHILQNCQEEPIKKLAAVEAKNLVIAKWDNIDPTVQGEIRSSLLQFCFQYPNKSIRHLATRIVARIAEIDIASDKWADLLPTLVNAANDSNADTKEMAIFILSCILEEGPENWLPHTNDFLSLFATVLQSNPSEEIQARSLSALETLATLIEEHYKSMKSSAQAFKNLMPLLLQVLRNSLSFQDGDKTKDIFNCFNGFIYTDLKVIGGENIIAIINFMMETALNTANESEIRCFSIVSLTQIISFRKAKISQAKLAPALTQCALKLACEEDEEAESALDSEDEDNENEEDEVPPLALRLLATLANELPPAQVIAPILELAPQLLQSANPFEKRGALLSMGVACAGAPDYISTQLPKVIQFITTGLQDSSMIVKAGALRTMNDISSYLKEGVAEYHKVLLPLIIGIIDSTDKILVYKLGTLALDNIIEFMEYEPIKEYLEPLMNKLFHMLDVAQSSSLKAVIVSAIGSCAFASGKAFTPFLDASIKFLEKFIVNMDNIEGMTDDDIELRGMTFENISSMARAVGSEAFTPYAQELISASSLAINSSNGRLREAGFTFISNMAKIYGEEFTGFLDSIIPEIIKCLKQEEFEFDIDEDALLGGEIDEDAIAENTKIHTGITLEKDVALYALSELAIGTKDGFTKYATKVFEVLAEQIDDSYAVRESSLTTMWTIAQSLYNIHGLNDITKGFINICRKVTIELVREDYELNMIITCLDLFCEYMTSMKQIAVMQDESDTKTVETLCTTLMLLLKNQHPCQMGDNEADEDEEEEEEAGERDASETDEVLYDATLEVLIKLSGVFGGEFVKIFAPFKDILLKDSASKSRDKRNSAIGCLAEICNGMKEANPYSGELLELFVAKLCDDKSYKVRASAAYAVGIVVEVSGIDATAGFPTILQALSTLLNKADKQALKTEDGDDETKETININIANACGCVCRLAIKNPAAVPLQAILPTLLDHLPLEEALEENKPIFEFFLKLYSENNELIAQQTPRVLEIFDGVFKKDFERQKVVSESSLGRETTERLNQFESDELRAKVVELLKFIESNNAGSVSSKEYLKLAISA